MEYEKFRVCTTFEKLRKCVNVIAPPSPDHYTFEQYNRPFTSALYSSSEALYKMCVSRENFSKTVY